MLKDVPLDEPITLGETTIEAVRLRKPNVGELRGLKMLDVFQMEGRCMTTLISRISEPHLSEADIINHMGPSDFATLASEAMLFFVPSDVEAAQLPTTSKS